MLLSLLYQEVKQVTLAFSYKVLIIALWMQAFTALASHVPFFRKSRVGGKPPQSASVPRFFIIYGISAGDKICMTRYGFDAKMTEAEIVVKLFAMHEKLSGSY